MTELITEIAVTGLGMVSPLGLDVATSCAAARAGLSRAKNLDTFSVYSETEWSDVPVVGHAVPQYADGYEGFGKFFRLGCEAFKDLLSYEGVCQIDFSRTAIIINLSSYYYARLYQAHESDASIDEFSRADLEALVSLLKTTLISKIISANNIDIPSSNQFIMFGDQSGIATAISDASVLLSSGQCDYCIVGGIDSYIEKTVLNAATYFNLVKTEGIPVGFQPGEAAAFVLLEKQNSAMEHGVRIDAIVGGSTYGQESCHRLSEEELPLGMALTECIIGTMDYLTKEDIKLGLTIGNLNGDSFRSNEWGYALLRLGSKFPTFGEQPQWYPALSFGETGAATGFIAICMVIRGFNRDYSPSANALVWLSSDTGATGSFFVRKYTEE